MNPENKKQINIEKYNYIAGKIAGKWFRKVEQSNPGLEYNDLYHYGLLGLYEALTKYDETNGVQFSSFARYRVEGEILDFLRKSSVIKLPQKQMKEYKELQDACFELQQRLKREPENEELTAFLKISPDRFEKIRNFGIKFEEFSEDKTDDAANGLDEHDSKLLWENFDECLNRLDKKLRIILEKRLANVNLKKTAAWLKVSHETVRRREISAKAVVKKCLESKGWSVEDIV